MPARSGIGMKGPYDNRLDRWTFGLSRAGIQCLCKWPLQFSCCVALGGVYLEAVVVH